LVIGGFFIYGSSFPRGGGRASTIRFVIGPPLVTFAKASRFQPPLEAACLCFFKRRDETNAFPHTLAAVLWRYNDAGAGL
jgi:hypothetical protein